MTKTRNKKKNIPIKKNLFNIPKEIDKNKSIIEKFLTTYADSRHSPMVDVILMFCSKSIASSVSSL